MDQTGTGRAVVRYRPRSLAENRVLHRHQNRKIGRGRLEGKMRGFIETDPLAAVDNHGGISIRTPHPLHFSIVFDEEQILGNQRPGKDHHRQ
ncbi:MAG TPA: hypothetical protein VGM64_17720 [Lacunisphaera sp.]